MTLKTWQSGGGRSEMLLLSVCRWRITQGADLHCFVASGVRKGTSAPRWEDDKIFWFAMSLWWATIILESVTRQCYSTACRCEFSAGICLLPSLSRWWWQRLPEELLCGRSSPPLVLETLQSHQCWKLVWIQFTFASCLFALLEVFWFFIFYCLS